MILLYKVLSIILYPIFIILIYLRKLNGKEDSHRFREKIYSSYFNIKEKKAKLIWFHAASIGEFKSILPIIGQLNINNKNLEFLITTTTLSSGNLAKKDLKQFRNVEHRFCPIDVPFLMEKFIYLWKPDKIFLVDSEIWPNLILKAKKYKIPIALVNARLTSKSFKKWMIFPKVAEKIFQIFDLCICANARTKNYLEKLNAKNIYFKGNIKLINAIEEKDIKNSNTNILHDKRFWLAASTHKEEDIFCIKTHLKLKEKFKDIITIIAPRHIERSEKILLLAKKFNLNVQILNKNENILQKKEIIIVNYFGALTSFFKYAKSVYMGKSMILRLKDQGGQNPIEAAQLGCKIYNGPYIYNFEDIYKVLEENNFSKKVENYLELSDNLVQDLKDSKKNINQSKHLINKLAHKTLTDTMILINNFLDDKNK